MKVLSIVKRIAPFALTFAVGLFIASFFVTVGAPNFRFGRGFNKHREMDRQLRIENERLREENNRLNKRLEEMQKRDWVIEPSFDVPPPPPPAVMPMRSVPSKAR